MINVVLATPLLGQPEKKGLSYITSCTTPPVRKIIYIDSPQYRAKVYVNQEAAFWNPGAILGICIRMSLFQIRKVSM
jgi:hypothetical protein